ncbi:MAG: hypothetical protein SFU98_15810 [Leptospiraceae bacterium]|nr:hypothetical protein [Leptospiraceae bacterium]
MRRFRCNVVGCINTSISILNKIVAVDGDGILELDAKDDEIRSFLDSGYMSEVKTEDVTETPESDETDELKSALEKMSLDEMIALAVKAQYPESEYSKMMKNEKLMRKYLISKI